MESEVRSAFINRPRLVEHAPGFCGIDVLTDAGDPSVFMLLTRWADEESFRAWHRSAAHHQSHGCMPHGLKLDASFTAITVGNGVEDPAGTRNIDDAIEGETVGLSRWLMKSDAVFALLLAADGTILARNRAGGRVFPVANKGGSGIFDYIVCSDREKLRQMLSAPGDERRDCLLVNLADGQQNPITLEAWLVRCKGATLFLATQETKRDSQLQSEIFRLTNDLSMMTRETARKNRELEAANETNNRLSRTDPLTGLANRRMLDESFAREIALAERLNGRLSVIMADIDRFKSINDQFGHLTGDHVLQGVASIFGSRLRPYDLAARYAGEEFILLLPGSSMEEAVEIAERIRNAVSGMKIPECPSQITISLGVAAWANGEAPEQLVARADAALYDAKESGRNRVKASSEVMA